ncbi:MAG: hypothetical protein AAGB34_05795 [Planctomycetota bacterium]
MMKPGHKSVALLAAAMFVSTVSTVDGQRRQQNEDDDQPIRPPAVETPAKAQTFLTIGVIVLAGIVVLVPAAYPSKRGHQD